MPPAGMTLRNAGPDPTVSRSAGQPARAKRLSHTGAGGDRSPARRPPSEQAAFSRGPRVYQCLGWCCRHC